MKKVIGIFVVALIGATAISLTACSKDDAGDPVTGVELNVGSRTMEVGEELVLTATLEPGEATNKKVTWKSSDPTVAEIDFDGLTCAVTALKAGPATITVTTKDGGYEDICNITVRAGESVIDSGTAGPLTWSMTDRGVLTISGEGEMPDYDYIYDYWDSHSTTPWADHLGSAMKLVVEEGVTRIGVYAFSHTIFLTDVSLPNSLTSIGEHAFSYNEQLAEITIPSGVTSLPPSLFYKSYGLARVTLPDGLKTMGTKAFFDCMGLEGITIPDTVTKIESSCFAGCSFMTEIVLPEGLTSIGSHLFDTCMALKKVTIPSTVTSIGNAAFFYCGLTEITLPEDLKTLGDEVFMGCRSLERLTIPASVTSIGTLAFLNCDVLTELTLLPVTPPSLGVNPTHYPENVSLYVPANSVQAYKDHPDWGFFPTITAMP